MVKDKINNLQSVSHDGLQIITAVLIIIGVLGPFIMVGLDGWDYQRVEDHIDEVKKSMAMLL